MQKTLKTRKTVIYLIKGSKAHYQKVLRNEGITSSCVASSYFCDECEHECHSKKSLEKNKAQKH